MFLEDKQYYEINIEDKNALPAFHKNFYIIINLAVGGIYTDIFDPNGISAPLPAQMIVDCVKVY